MLVRVLFRIIYGLFIIFSILGYLNLGLLRHRIVRMWIRLVRCGGLGILGLVRVLRIRGICGRVLKGFCLCGKGSGKKAR